MKQLLHILLISLLSYSTQAQPKRPTCNCPKIGYGSKSSATFDLGNGGKISLCGYRQKGKKDTTYEGFILFQCGRKEVIDECDETYTCKINQIKDTLVVSEYDLLPIGKNFGEVSLPFRIDKFFFRWGVVADTSYYLRSLPKYSTAQINKVLQQYARLSRNDYDSINMVAHRLFWAY